MSPSVNDNYPSGQNDDCDVPQPCDLGLLFEEHADYLRHRWFAFLN